MSPKENLGMERNIINLHKNWIETEVADPINIVKYCSNDIELFVFPDLQIVGKSNFLAWLEANKDDSKIESIEILNRKVSCLNQLGCLIADFKTVIRTKENELRTIYGQHFWHLKLENECWKVAKLTWDIKES